jgi:FHS family L-fucose permease-like MFS transporter
MAITNVGGTTKISGSSSGSTNYSAMAMVTALFFIWGFCTVLNDAAIPHLQNIFGLNYVQAGLVQFSFFISYFIFAQPAGKLIEWVGYQRTMVIGLITMGVGALVFLPAASRVSYAIFLVAEVILAAGITILQVAANPYVTILGPPSTASSRLNFTQAFNTLGDTVAPYVGGALILGGAGAAEAKKVNMAQLQGAALTAFRVEQASSFKLTYGMIAIVVIVLALAIAIYKFPRLELTRDFRPANLAIAQDSIWHHPHLYLGAIGIFIYCGAEVSIGTYGVKYIADPHVAGVPLALGAKLLAFYWGGMMVGRFVGSALMQRIAANKLLAWSGAGAAVLVLCSLLSTGHVAEVTILSVGLFNSIMFPTIFTLAVAELGPLTSRGSGLLVQAIVGAAFIPLISGLLADHLGIHASLIPPLLCYLFVIYYGWRGYRIAPDEPHSQIKTL